MARFHYEAYDARGAVVVGALESSTRESALQALARDGVHALSLQESAGEAVLPWWQRDIFSAAGLKEADRLVFTRELSALAAADLPIDDALSLIALQPGVSSRIKIETGRLLERVREGKSLSQAMAASPLSFPPYYWRLIAAAETSGALGDVLGDLTRTLERSAEVRSKITAALAYPALLIAVALAAVCVVTLVLVPAVMPLFADAGASPPLLLSVLSAIAAVMRANWPAFAISAALITVIALWAVRRPEGRRIADAAWLRVPIAGGLIRTRETGRFARLLSLQLKNGVSLIEALNACAPAMGNRIFENAVSNLAQGMREGGTFSKECAAAPCFSELVVRLSAIGERTGALDVMLARVASIHEAALQTGIDRLTRLLGPALTLIVGVLAGGLILSVMQAILSLNDLAVHS